MSLIIYALRQILFSGQINEDEMGGSCSTHGKDHVGDLRRNLEDNINIDLKKIRKVWWTGFVWLNTGICDGPR